MTITHVFLSSLLLIITLGGATSLSIWLLLIDRPFIHKPSVSHPLLVLLSTWSIVQVGTGLFLGLAGHLTLLSLTLAELLLFITGTILLWVKLKDSPNRSREQLFENLKFHRTNLLVLNSILLLSIYLLINLTTRPVTDFDSLWFHLPAIARWYQTGSFTLLDTAGNWIFEHPDAASYPYNWHVLSLLFLLPLRTDLLVTLPALLAWAMLGLSVYLLSQELGANRLYSMVATLLLLSMPFLMDRVNTAQVDLPLSALFTASLYFAYSHHKTRSPVNLFLAMGLAGLLCGTKIPGIFYAALVGGVWVGLELYQRFILTLNRNSNLSNASLSGNHLGQSKVLILIGWFSLIFLGGFWYVYNLRENAIALHNPGTIYLASRELSLSPQVSILSSTFERLSEYQQSTLTHQFNPINLSHWKVVIFQAVTRFQLPFIALSLQILFLPYIWIRYPKACLQQSFILAFLLFLLSGFLYWNTPYSSGTAGLSPNELSPIMGHNMRYGFPFLAMAAVMAAVAATIMQTSQRIVLAIAWWSGLLGILSTNLLSTLQAQILMGDRRIWLSRFAEQAFSQPGQLLELGADFLQQQGLVILVITLIYGLTTFWILRYQPSELWVNETLVRLQQSMTRHSLASTVFQGSVITLIIIMLGIGLSGPVKRQEQTRIYRGIHQYLEQAVEPNHKIAYFSSSRNYLLYGHLLDQTVLHQIPDSQNPQQWLAQLQDKKVSHIAAGPRLNPKSERGQVLQSLLGQGLIEADFGEDPGQELVVYQIR